MLVFVLDLADMTARLEMSALAAMFLQLPNVDFIFLFLFLFTRP